MGCMLHSLFWFLSPRRAASCKAIGIQLQGSPVVGGYGGRRPTGREDDQVPPQAFKDRPLWQRGRYHSRQYWLRDLCPVAAVLSYAAARGSHQGPFFVTSNARPLTKQEFINEIRRVLARLGLPDNEYAGHSFRIGAATSAALAGIKDSTIQLLGRWQSAAFLRYIRTPHEQLASISTSLAAQARGSSAGP